MNRRLIGVFGLFASLAARTLAHQDASQAFPLDASLTAYASGKVDEALRPVADVDDLERAYDALATSGAAWIHAQPDSARGRLAAASFALEIASPRPLQKAAPSGAVGAAMVAIDRRLRLEQLLIAWGAAALASENPIVPTYAKVTAAGRVVPVKPPRINVPVQAAEREWFRAAAVTLENGGWSTLLDLSREPASGLTGLMGKMTTPSAFPLLPLALARVPNDPLLLLVRANAELERDIFMNPVVDHLPMRDYVPSERSSWSQDALAHYRALAAAPDVAAEACLRVGFIEIRLGQRAKGRADLAKADQLSIDPEVKFISRLLAGTAWQTEHRLDEAEQSYRSALEAVPHARSASSLLAAALTNTDRIDEAAAVLDGESSESADPWTTFKTNFDRRLEPELRARLREQLR